MPGASEGHADVKALNVNTVAGEEGDDGRFEAVIVTEDDDQHTIAPSPASMTALVGLAQPDSLLLRDPTNHTPITANAVGKWLEEVPGATAVRRWTS